MRKRNFVEAIDIQTMHKQNYPVIQLRGTNVAILPMSVPEKWDFRTKTRVEPYELVEMALKLFNGVSKTEREQQLALIKDTINGTKNA